MRLDARGRLTLAATDLSNFLSCRHKTALELDVARGIRTRPVWKDDLAELLRERGQEHEARYVERQRSAGKAMVNLAHLGYQERDEAVAETWRAMRTGVELIVQGALQSPDGLWFGLADVLRRVEGESRLGAWHYEALDMKLARETRGATILQLSLYSALLDAIQGRAPEYFHVVTPVAEGTYRVTDFAAYFRLVRDRLQGFVGAEVTAETYPEPVDHCDVCVWWQGCTAQRRADDHLSFVANMSRLQRRECVAAGVTTLEQLARGDLPASFTPRRGATATYERATHQARLQLAARERGAPVFELVVPTPVSGQAIAAGAYPAGLGLARLPAPSHGDLFLDLEGSAFAREGGREYLFGVVSLDESGPPVYHASWAHTDLEEQRAFEAFIDLAMRRWADDAAMHVYHYAPYEPAALKRLMGRHATRVRELDRLLRAGRFVDLYAVVRQSVRAGVERYSIKNLEVFYGFTRAVDLRDAGARLRVVEHQLELGMPEAILDEDRRIVQGYNEDDCRSALGLRDWLEARRADTIVSGVDVLRPAPNAGDASEDLKEQEQQIEALRARLLDGVPADHGARSSEEHGRYLLAYLIDFHRREDKASWWEFFRLRDMPQEDYEGEAQAISGLEFIERVEVVYNKRTGAPTGSIVNRYRYPSQEMDIPVGGELKLPVSGEKFGEVAGLDRVLRTVDVKQGRTVVDLRPTGAFCHKHISPKAIVDALVGLAGTVGLNLGDVGPYQAARDLLLRRAPRLATGEFVRRADENPVEFAVRLGLTLDRTSLAIQGPPGTGKTFTGAQMICELVKAGRKVGVTANSHKVIVNLLEAAAAAAPGRAADLRIVRKGGDVDETGAASIEAVGSNDEIVRRLAAGEANVVGGTAWLWAHQDMVNTVDVLFVDEAGQMSLANVLGASPAAKSLVLLGDPRQLDQPRKGSHPDGIHVSALDHVLDGHQTMPEDRGVFLPTTWRLSPPLCAFTSETFYEGRLDARDDLSNQQIIGPTPFAGAGLWIVSVPHEGNQNASSEEVEVVDRLVRDLLNGEIAWMNAKGEVARLRPDDFRVIAPYNAQVSRLTERLGPLGIPVGTVDKFQGQEAPVVIYSMATSRPEDAPRGMEFLYSVNRLNVATSRGQCVVIVVASPALFEPECKSPHQMRLANALCRLRELARV